MIDSYVAVDLETTGLNAKYEKIIEIGAIKVINGKTIDKYETFVAAGKKLPAKITNLTGITDDMLEGAKSQREAIIEFVDFCEDMPLLGHNIMFDFLFLKKQAVNENLPFEKAGIDTLKIARKYLPDLEKRSLDYLCEYFQIARVHSHRAFEDAVAAKQLYEILAERFDTQDSRIFSPVPLFCKVKKEAPITNSQKVYLNDLMKYHRIEIDAQVEGLTKSEASRYIDKIISAHGKIKRGV